MRGNRTHPRQAEWFFDMFTGPREPLTRKQKWQRLAHAVSHMFIIALFLVLVFAAGSYAMYRNGWYIGLK